MRIGLKKLGPALGGSRGPKYNLPAGAAWVTTNNGTQYVTAVIGGKVKRIYATGALDIVASTLTTDAAIGDIVGSFSARSPGGWPVTVALANDGGGGFAISGSNLIVAAPITQGVFPIIVTASDGHGWTYTKVFDITVTQPAITLQTAAFSKTLQLGVALSGVTVNGTVDGSDVSTDIPGVTIDTSVYPPSASGTPTSFGSYSITETRTGASGSPKSSGVNVLDGAPSFTVNPAVTGTFQVGQTVTTSSGTAPGATSFAYQWFSRPGTSGNGTAISGAFNASRTIPQADQGTQYRCRVRAFRGSLFAEYFTPWSSSIIAADAGAPVFTSASSFSGNAGVGETLTAVPGNGTGTASVQWTADNVEIAGATSWTYVQQWADRYKAIKPVISRSNAQGVVADTTVLTAITCTPKLSGAFHGNATWLDGSVMRWMTPVLCTPYEPGKNGTAKVKPTPTSARNRTFDQRIDVYYRGNLHWETPGTPINNTIVNAGARYAVYMCYDQNGYKDQHTKATGRVSWVGVDGDFGPFGDQKFYGGSDTDPNPGFQRTDIQGCYLPTRGTYANPWLEANNPGSGFNQVPIKSITKIDAKQVSIMLDISAPPSYLKTNVTPNATINWRPPTNCTYKADKDGNLTVPVFTSYIIAYAVQAAPGVVNGLNVDWNTNYEVISYNPATGEVIAIPNLIGDGDTFGGSGSSVANTGKAVCLSKSPDNHSDGGQKNKGVAGRTRRHANTYYGNYTAWGVDGNTAESNHELIISCENIRRLLTYDPQEYKAPLLYMALSTGSTYYHEATNIYIEYTWEKVGLGSLMFPGTPQGAQISTLPNGNQFLAFGGANYTNWRGGVELGLPPSGDYAPPSRNFWNWVPSFYGQRNPVNADMTGISISSATVSAAAPIGTEIGQLLLANTWDNDNVGLNDAAGRVLIYDYQITGADAAKVTQGWSGLLYTAAAITAPITLQVKAVIRDSALNYGAEVSYGPVAITINPS